MRKISCWGGRAAGVVVLLLLLGGCKGARYTVPGGPADFVAMGATSDFVEANTEYSIAQRLALRPLAGFPTAIAVARVQAAGYRSHTAHGYGEGHFSVVTMRDVEREEHVERLLAMPMIRGIAPLNRLVLPRYFGTSKQLREAAASVQADMLLLYTFDTKFSVKDEIPPLGVLTLGLFPDDHARINTTVSGVLMDTRNGYVYGLMEATARRERTTNGWVKDAVVDKERREAEAEAFDRFVDELEANWHQIVAVYGP